MNYQGPMGTTIKIINDTVAKRYLLYNPNPVIDVGIYQKIIGFDSRIILYYRT